MTPLRDFRLKYPMWYWASTVFSRCMGNPALPGAMPRLPSDQVANLVRCRREINATHPNPVR